MQASAVAVFVEWWIVVFVDIMSFHRGICTFGASFCLLRHFCDARKKVSSETCNAGIIRQYLAFHRLKLVYEASFSSYQYGVICLLPKAKLSTVDCLEAYRLEFYYRKAAQVQRNCVSKLWKLSRSCAKHCRHAQLNCG